MSGDQALVRRKPVASGSISSIESGRHLSQPEALSLLSLRSDDIVHLEPSARSRSPGWRNSGAGHSTSTHQSNEESISAVTSTPKSFSNDQTKSYPSIEGWPSEPKWPIARDWGHWSDAAVDAAMLLGAFPFFALAIAVAKYHHHEVNTVDQAWFQNTTRVAGTMFPIFFAAIVGRAARKAASWHLERGATLGMLEQLIGSQTIFSTVTTQISLRSFNLLALSLSLIWIFSPAGGQAALRLIGTGNRPLPSVYSLSYFNSDSQPRFASMTIESPTSDLTFSGWFEQLNALYIASVLASMETKNGSTDIWGNVKIPLLSSYTDEGQEWVPTPEIGEGLAYTSLVGVPLTDTTSGNTTLSIESTYIELGCSALTDGPIFDLNRSALDIMARNDYYELGDLADNITSWRPAPNGTFYGYNDYEDSSSNYTGVSATWTLGLDMFVSHLYNSTDQFWGRGVAYPGLFINDSNVKMEQGTLLFQSMDAIGEEVARENSTKSRCKPSQVYVESQILCTESTKSTRSCSVTAQRYSQKPHTQPNITLLSWPESFTWISDRLPRAFQISGLNDVADPSVYYITNPDPSYITTAEGSANFSNVSPYLLSVRLSQLVNTYLNLGQIGFGVTGTMSAIDDSIAQNLTTHATTTNLEEIFVVSWWPWFTIFLVATTLMFAAGFISMIYSRLTLNPSVLGLVSTGVRDSRFVELPVGGGTLSGIEMSRLLKDMRVRMGGVEISPMVVGNDGGAEKYTDGGGKDRPSRFSEGDAGESGDGVVKLAVAEEKDVVRTKAKSKYL